MHRFMQTLAVLFDVPVGILTPLSFEEGYCFLCGPRQMAVSRSTFYPSGDPGA